MTKIWKKKGVLLERGHGPNPKGFEPGAVAHGKDEYTLNGIACEAARNYLVKLGIPCTITDSGSTLHSIGKLAQGYDVFCSIHHNAFNGSTQGVECLYHNKLGDPADKELAELIASQLQFALGYSNRGAKPQALGVLSGAETTDVRASVLAECYFMDAVRSSHEQYSRFAGEAIGKAIESWLRKNQ
jgi:N-acetylmuramoyl-L-alanine amidase